MRSVSMSTEQPFVTWGLIGLNVIVYLITVAQGAGINSPGGKLFNVSVRRKAPRNGSKFCVPANKRSPGLISPHKKEENGFPGSVSHHLKFQ